MTGAEKETKEGKWSRQYRERDPAEWSKWEKYRKTRDYQIRATVGLECRAVTCVRKTIV